MILNEKETLIAQLAILLEADKETKKEEMAVLAGIANKLKIDRNRILEIISNKDFAKFEFDSNEVKRAENLYTLLFMIQVDGNIHKNEEKLVLQLGMRMGFREDMIKELINEAINSDFKLSTEYFIETVKRYSL
jgi:uncharacterized tellurite resistance protein B-like protein